MYDGVCVCFIRTVLLVSPDEDVPPEVQSVSERLSSTQHSSRDVTITLILHAFQAALGTGHDLQALHTTLQVTHQHVLDAQFLFYYFLPKPNILMFLQTKRPEELEQLVEAVTDRMETAASTADLSTARRVLLQSMERLRESLAGPGPADGCPDTGETEYINTKSHRQSEDK